jgi:FkbM family methyltransferase
MYFDIGANVGKWSLANINDCNKIIAIEASPSIYLNLLNIHTNIISLNFAVCANECKDIVFYEAEQSTLSTLNLNWLNSEESRFYGTKYKEIICKTITLDKLINIYGIPDLIKIDVEGGEYECIKSLTQCAKDICFEWTSETNDINIKCVDHLYELGYRLFFIQDKDEYTFKPNEYYSINVVKQILSYTTPKHQFGMLWCRLP